MKFKQVLPVSVMSISSTVLISAASSHAANLIINGDFADTSDAGLEAFVSGYDFDGVRGDAAWSVQGGDRQPGEYIISSNPASNVPDQWPDLSSFDPGNDNLLVADSFSSGSADRVLWGQDITVEAGTNYQLSFAAAQLFTTDVAVEVKVNGESIFSQDELSEQGVWDVLETDWISNVSGIVSLEIFQNRDIDGGTDIALDAISLVPLESVPEPSSIFGLAVLGIVSLFKWRKSM